MEADNTNPAINWENIPTVALVHIQSYLEPKDSLSAGLVNRRWNLAFKDPKLWKSIEHTFAGNRKVDNVAIAYCRLHPTHVRNLYFDFKCQDLGKFRRAILHAILCLNAIRRRKLSYVREVRIDVPCSNYFRNLHIGVRTKFTNALAGFLSKQVNLVVLEINGLALPYPDGFNIFSQVVRNNQNLSNVALKDFFALHKPDIFWEEFGHALGRLKNLRKIAVTMDCLTDKVMEILAEDAPKNVLKHFSIRVGERHMENIFSTKLTKNSQLFWTKLERKNPGLTINVHTEDGVSITAVTEIFMRPGFKKQLLLKVPQTNPNRGILAFLQHESEFLEEIDSLKVVCNFGNLVNDSVITLVYRCSNLRHFSFTGTTGNDVIDKINQWVTEAQGRTIAIDNQPAPPVQSSRRRLRRSGA